MLGDIVEGAVMFGTSFIDNKARKDRIASAESAYQSSINAYFGQDTSNLMAGLENISEDLTVDRRAAEFTAGLQRQNLADTLGAVRSAAGSSGISALAASLARPSHQAAQRASIDIAQQERANQMAERREAANIQMAERQGEARSRALRANLLEQRATIDANELAAANKAQQDAIAARREGLAKLGGGVTDALFMGFTGDAGFGKNYIENLTRITE